MTETPISPLGDRVLIQPDEPITTTASGIYVPEGVEKARGTVIAVGPSEEIKVKAGDKVLLPQYGRRIRVAGVEYVLVENKYLDAVFN